MARGGTNGAPLALEAPISHPGVERLWAVSAHFSHRHRRIPHSAQAAWWQARDLHEHSTAQPLTPSRARQQLDVLRALSRWQPFRIRPGLGA